MPLSPPSPDAIQVGYISQTEGYISGLSVDAANNYEKINPGTVYIFRDGDGRVRYLTINQVNELSTKNLLRTDPCSTTPKPCGPPILNFFGGEGIGAEGNPIVDAKGELIAVDIVNGGYGLSDTTICSSH